MFCERLAKCLVAVQNCHSAAEETVVLFSYCYLESRLFVLLCIIGCAFMPDLLYFHKPIFEAANLY